MQEVRRVSRHMPEKSPLLRLSLLTSHTSLSSDPIVYATEYATLAEASTHKIRESDR
jgi:hypothetical protein